MQYNESMYNGDSYNLTNYTQTLVETMTEVDGTIAKSISVVRTDSQGTADALSDGVSLAAILNTVTIFQRARTPFAYNNGMYNQFMYNARFDEDEILLMAGKLHLEDMFLSAVMQPFAVEMVRLEVITPVDQTVFFFDLTTLDDFVFLSEFIHVEITNKALNDTLRLADWLSIERNPVNNEWYD